MANSTIYAQKSLRDRSGSVDSLGQEKVDSIRATLDSLKTVRDTLINPNDTVDRVLNDTLAFPIADSDVDKEVQYDARDSIVYDIENEMIYLYGAASISYDDIQISAGKIKFNYVTKTIEAELVEDEDGVKIERPVLLESGKEYTGDRMVYNFETKKGKISQLLTTDDSEGYIRGAEVKKNEYDELFANEAYYTTCELDHPHFQIDVEKVKIIPDKLVVSGPANLVIADVPTPLVLPFGLFPLDQHRSSGIKLPRYGESPNLGFYLEGGGYYWAINDYVDLALTGSIYTSGSWQANLLSRYRMRYRYNGTTAISFGRRFTEDRITPNFSTANDFRIRWSHRQDAKARPNSTFSTNVNITSSNFDREYGNTSERVLDNVLNSNITYSYNFPRAPFSLSASFIHTQNINTHDFVLTLPQLNVNMQRIYPFERRNRIGAKQWYENIGLTYGFLAENELRTLDTLLFEKETYKEFNYAARHNASLSTNIKLFKHFTLSPSLNYTERWYFEYLDRTMVQDSVIVETGEVMDVLRTDTILGFRPVRNFSTGASLSTNLYGMYNFSGKRLKAIRHVLTPNVGYSYNPSYSTEFWDYYQNIAITDTTDRLYSRFQGFMYGTPPSGESGSITFGLTNRIEAKVNTPEDTVKKDKKIEILRSLNLNTSYNLAVDSFNLADLRITANTTFLNRFRVNFSSAIDPYVYDDTLQRRINSYEWRENRRLGRFKNATLTIGTRFTDADFEGYSSEKGTDGEIWELNEYPERFLDFNKKWSLGLDYKLNLSRINQVGEDSLRILQTLSANFDLNLTDKWKINGRTGFNFQTRELSYTNFSVARDLHCWQMSFNIVPFGDFRSYTFNIGVKSSVLQDLKLTRRRNWYDY